MNATRFLQSSLLIIGLCLFVSSSQAAPKSEELSNAYSKSFQYEKVGDYDNAINSLLVLQKSIPGDYTLHLRLGYLYLSSQKYANAITHYQKAHETAPAAIPPQLGLIRIMNIQGKYADSQAAGYQVLQTDMYNYFANLYLAYSLRMDNKLDAALQINLKMLAVYPTDKLFLLEYSLLSIAQSNFEGAKRALQYLLMLDPENVTAKEALQSIIHLPKVKK